MQPGRRPRLPKSKLALVHVAKKQLGLSTEDYRAVLTRYGGVESAADLDGRAFEAVMHRFRALGFTSDYQKRALGDRAGMASPAQIELIRALWREVVEDPTELALTHWLERHHKVSALRFLDQARAGKVIVSLRSWKGRLEGAKNVEG